MLLSEPAHLIVIKARIDLPSYWYGPTDILILSVCSFPTPQPRGHWKRVATPPTRHHIRPSDNCGTSTTRLVALERLLIMSATGSALFRGL